MGVHYRQRITYEYMGETMTLREWAKRYDMHPTTLYSRVQDGWPIGEALTRPIERHAKARRAERQKDVKLCDKKVCKKCRYSVGSSHESREITCDYILQTGQRRPCPAGACTVFEPKVKRRPSKNF